MKAELKRKKIEFWGLWCWWCKWLLLRESHFLPPVLSVWSVGRGEKRGVIKNSPSPAWGVFRKESLLNQGKSLSLLETLLDSFLSVHEEQMCLSHVKGKKQSTQGWGGRGWALLSKGSQEKNKSPSKPQRKDRVGYDYLSEGGGRDERKDWGGRKVATSPGTLIKKK